MGAAAADNNPNSVEETMRLAIPSDDGVTIAQHTGRARGFVVYEISGDACRRLAFRNGSVPIGSAPAQACGQGTGDCAHSTSGAAGHHSHQSHGSILELIGDCEVMVACGAGPRLVNDLARKGVRLMFCRERTVEDAARLFTKGKLDIQPEGTCDHHHH